MLKMKNSINQTKNTVESITIKLGQAEEGKSGIEDKVKEILYSDNNNEKNKPDYNFQELWDIIKIPNLRIHEVKEVAEIQTKGIENSFKETLTESFPNVGKDTDIQIQKALRTPNPYDQERINPCHIIVKIPRLQNKEFWKLQEQTTSVLTISNLSVLQQTSQEKP
jgi:hypothetical protein